MLSTPTRCTGHFYPRSPRGERQGSSGEKDDAGKKFLSTLSSRRATDHQKPTDNHHKISIHALLAESDWANCFYSIKLRISIHALLAESDGWANCFYSIKLRISIHALLAESDGAMAATITPTYEFLSTLSSRRATQNIQRARNTIFISIHALLAESDSKKQQKIGSFVAELAILPLQYALSLDLSKYFRRYSSVFEKLFGAKVPEF